VKQATKAALWSALVFPGVGHIYLKRYVAGAALCGVSFAALYYLFAQVMTQAMAISDKIRSGAVAPDVQAITGLVSRQAAGADPQLLNLAATILTVCWLVGIVDAYRVGRRQDLGDA